ncbi:MAG: CoA-binding protein [Nitrospinota bacterium]|jgi:acetyltransferase|nr:CoA-binding protein [Nitrospinota bacterium]HJM42142.1 CoA-binding protein [Nitrospinota bacterium]
MLALSPFLEPRSIAVVGASASEVKPGHIILKNIIGNGFSGAVHPVNPRGGEILGRKAFASISEIPGELDLAFLVLPRQSVSSVLKEAGACKVRAAVIVSAGFAEIGPEGRRLQAELEEIARLTGIRCLGPNTIGLLNRPQDLVATFIPFTDWQDGPISLMGQWGIFAGALGDELMHRESQRLGIGKNVSFGNMMDVDEVDFLEYCTQDPKTGVLGIHVEGMRRPELFFSQAQDVSRTKPVILLKSGRTAQGADAASRHTGRVATDEALVREGVARSGVVRARNLDEFLAFLLGFDRQPLPPGGRVAVLSYSGGSNVLAVDELTEEGLVPARLSAETRRRVGNLLPDWQPVFDPADIGVAQGHENKKTHGEALAAVLDDPGVDAVLYILCVVPNSDFDGVAETFGDAIAKHPEKPVLLVGMGGAVKRNWLREVEDTRLPMYATTALAARTLGAMHHLAEFRKTSQGAPESEGSN